MQPALPRAVVLRSGFGRARSAASARRAAHLRPDAVAVAGFCGATASGLRPGDIIVASEVRGPGGVTTCESGPLVAALSGLLAEAPTSAGRRRVHVGPVTCAGRPVFGAARAALAAQDVLAADMESAWLAPVGSGRPFVVLRVVLDTPERELYRPLATLSGLVTACRSLRWAAPALSVWAGEAQAAHAAAASAER